jgi:peroxiredoxin/predicted 2-oxoglutarate/Fe(II)-dependent dioxygenase YbiX
MSPADITERLEPGDRAPNFILPCANGETLMFYDQVRGGPIVLLFDPARDAAAGPALQGLIDQQPALADLGAELFAVARQVAAADAAVVERGVLLFADADGKVAAQYKLVPDAAPVCFVLDANQRLLRRIDAAPERLAAEALAWLERHWHPPAPGPAGAVAPVLLVPRVLAPELCQHLIAAWQADHAEGGVSGAYGDAMAEEKKRSLDHIVRDPALRQRLSALLARRIGPELRKAFGFSGPLSFDAHIVLAYSAERGDFFGTHRDNIGPRLRHRRFAVSLNLNADFEGGALRFPEYGPALYHLAAGTACVFSCSLLHQALPVRRGRRFVLTTFLCDPQPQQRAGPGAPYAAAAAPRPSGGAPGGAPGSSPGGPLGRR